HEVIPCKYVEMDDFNFLYTCVKGLDDNAQMYNALIDLNDKVLLRTEHDLMNVFKEDSTLLCFQKNAKKGVLNLSGEVLVKPLYQSITIRTDYQSILAVDSTYTYLIPYQRPNEIYNLGRASYCDIDTFGRNALVFTIKDFSGGKQISHLSFFNRNLNLLSQTTAYRMKSNHPGWYVPDHFVILEDTKGAKEYLMNIKTGKKYKTE
ncbi:MAG: hypothetical protein ABJB16_15450, partial [Saprospiraceae bacterium]